MYCRIHKLSEFDTKKFLDGKFKVSLSKLGIPIVTLF